ncbi:MFS transporter [Acrocarpospora phusangensis]|uniref:MFS transporter n=1 Tax=Acrocarpospora phusangensis TaxID=1070424 RepID=A0A919Q4Y4_9ACTN|nr:MFS transporter [Acrocarpospora phusangensis]GIH22226.1 MFS transporter [Acrocarpospora phusangensis]
MSADVMGESSRTTTVRPGPLVLAGLVCGPFVSMVDSNAVNVAVSEIATELRAPLSTTGWIISAYLLGIGVSLPATAWLARRVGNRRLYMFALVAFAVSSAACGLAPGVEALIGLRAVQGVASAPLIPLALTLLFGGERERGARPPMVAGLLFFLAPALGPTIGGLLVAAGGWRLIFLVNVPLVAIGLLGVRRLPPDPPRADGDRSPLDLVGLALLGLGATSAIYGASLVTGHTGWGWIPAFAGLVLLAGYGVHARRTRHPALALGLLSTAASRVAVLVSVVASVVLFAMLFLIPVFLLESAHLSPVATGLVLLPQGITMGLCAGLGEKLVGTRGLRTTVALGMLLLAAVTALLLLVTPDTPPWLLALLLGGRGVALGLTLQPIIMGMMNGLAKADMADGTTVFNVAQRIGGSLGIAGIAAFYEARSGNAFHDTIWLLVALSLAGLALTPFLGRAMIPDQPR